MRVQGWDLFDTLIGRKCGTAGRLFEEVGRRAGEPRFVERRMAAERSLQERGVEYSLEDIYTAYESMFVRLSRKPLADLEWELELENVFAIRRYSKQLAPGDVIVSDMYLSEKQLRELIRKAGIRFDGRIYVSCYGKHTGEIWEKVKAAHKLAGYCGDHPVNDVTRPKRLGIKASLADTGLSAVEKTYAEYSPDLAWWARRHRLENITKEVGAGHLNYLQVEFNAPFLWAACQMLAEYAKREGVKRLLFMSRDCCMFRQMFERLHPEIESIYLYVNRDRLRTGSEDYFRYLNRLYTEDAALVDLAASCGSLKAALPRLNVTRPRIWCAVFLSVPFRVQLGPIRCEYATTNIRTRINNTNLEMLNYALHWHVADVDESGKPTFDDPGEYDMMRVEGYHQLFEKMLTDVPPVGGLRPAVRIKEPGNLLRFILEQIHREGKFLHDTFPRHLFMENIRQQRLAIAR